jgi:protein-S-isoprenylcysteine O-methyltransferase Ste14
MIRMARIGFMLQINRIPNHSGDRHGTSPGDPDTVLGSGTVRIQQERGHRVVSSGPYRWVRHPGYAGALLAYLATPIFLDAAFAFVAVAFVTIILVIRTGLEDKTLRDKLKGYTAYASRTRYRLLPGVW